MNSFKNQNKLKAFTLSYDDGVTQDMRLIELLNKYNLKCTFNLNSELLARPNILFFKDQKISQYKLHPCDVKRVYEGHEVAAHTLTHPLLTKLDHDEIVRQVEKDRENLSELVGYDVVGMAYPCGGENNDDRVAEIIKNETNIKYCRTIKSTGNFEPQTNLYRFNPTAFHLLDHDQLMKLGQEFLDLETDTPKIFYLWGHAYEMDYYPDSWIKLEEFFKLMSNRSDVFYGTNKEVLL